MKSFMRKYIYCAAVLVILLIFFEIYTGLKKDLKPIRKDSEDSIKITMGIWDAYPLLSGDELQREIEKRFHVEFVPVQINYANWTDAFQKAAATDQLPDLISHSLSGTKTYQTWIEQGLIRCFPDSLEAYPNLESYVSMDYIQKAKSDGKLWCLPRIGYESEESWMFDRVIIVRKDWRKEAGFDPVSNQKELEELAAVFQKNDFDQNGVCDTSGIEISNMYKIEGLYQSDHPFLCNTEKGWIEEDGRWIPAYASSEMAEALDYVQDLYKNGMIDPNFFFQYPEDPIHNFMNEKAGIFVGDLPEIVRLWCEKYPDRPIEEYLEIVRPWKSPDGNRYHFTTMLHWSELYISSSVDDEKMNRILEIFDFLLSDEFYSLLDTDLRNCPSSLLFFQLPRWNRDYFYSGELWYKDILSPESLEYIQKEMEWYKENTIRVPYKWTPFNLSETGENTLPNPDTIHTIMIECILSDQKASEIWPEKFREFADSIDLEQTIRNVSLKLFQ